MSLFTHPLNVPGRISSVRSVRTGSVVDEQLKQVHHRKRSLEVQLKSLLQLEAELAKKDQVLWKGKQRRLDAIKEELRLSCGGKAVKELKLARSKQRRQQISEAKARRERRDEKHREAA